MKPALDGNVLLLDCGYTALRICQNSHNHALKWMNVTVCKLSLRKPDIKKKREFCHEEASR